MGHHNQLFKQTASNPGCSRKSADELAKILGQSPTKTLCDYLHGVNISRFSELWKHSRVLFEDELDARIAWQIASPVRCNEIMSAIMNASGNRN